jgi:hypothetical protein
VTILTLARPSRRADERSFLLQRVQPAMTGLIDGSLSTLAPVFAVAFATHRPIYAFFAAWPPRRPRRGELTGPGPVGSRDVRAEPG